MFETKNRKKGPLGFSLVEFQGETPNTMDDLKQQIQEKVDQIHLEMLLNAVDKLHNLH